MIILLTPNELHPSGYLVQRNSDLHGDDGGRRDPSLPRGCDLVRLVSLGLRSGLKLAQR